MKCFSPLQGYRVFAPGDKPYITFKDNFKTNHRTEAVEIRCSNCIGCRLTKARDWAVRISHEASQHDENSFITLTYAPEHLPPYGGLSKKDWQDFMHRLRKELDRKYDGKTVRFYMCGEYGTDETQHNKLGRPHFHAIIFGHDFSDDRLFKEERNGNKTYVSPMLERVWGKGRTEIGSVTLESAGYVAGYVTKKLNGDKAVGHYTRVNKKTGEFIDIEPEFARMSRMPGIGKGWYEKFSDDLAKGFITVNGKQCSIPEFYKKLLSDRQPLVMERIEEEGKKAIKKQDRWNLEAEHHQVQKTNERSRSTL